MRICPTCRTSYTDDTLRYCLQDGATLVEQLESETPTVALNEQETIQARRQTSSQPRITTVNEGELAREAGARKEGGRSGLVWALIAVIAVLLLVVIGGAIGLAIYLNNSKTVSNSNSSNNTNTNANGGLFGSSGTISPTPTPTASTTPSPSPSSTTKVDAETAKKEVGQTVYRWKSMAEAQNLDSYMGNYADTIDYYNHAGASRSYVRSDKARAFDLYDTITVNLSNMSVSVDESGSTATATFDKEWEFEGPRNSSGKVQSQLKLRNVNGKWLIVGERDLKVYFTR